MAEDEFTRVFHEFLWRLFVGLLDVPLPRLLEHRIEEIPGRVLRTLADGVVHRDYSAIPTVAQ